MHVRLQICLLFVGMTLTQTELVCFAQTPFIVAHRGASYDAPENTLPAFQLAWEKEADAIEGDFYLTEDNQIVCIHDKSTGKYCPQDLSVADSTLAELKKLDVGNYKNRKFKGTQIPTIAEVFATVPKKKKIYVEIKCGPEIIPYLLPEIDKSSLTAEQVVIISFNAAVIEAMKKARPAHKAYWLTGFKQVNGKTTPSFDQVINTLKEIKADGVSSSKTRLTNGFVKAMRSAGFEHHVWTVNDQATAQKVFTWGARSITTDRPAYIRKAFNREGK